MPKLSRLAQIFLAFLPDKAYSVIQYVYKQRRIPNLKDPKTFNEKIQALKLRCRNPLLPCLVDKYAVREYVERLIGREHLIPLIGVYQDPLDIKFDELPSSFVLKATHGSGWNIICKNKADLDYPSAIAVMKKWLKSNFYWVGREWAYQSVTPRIVCETMITDDCGNPPPDYKFFCFHGAPRFIQVDLARFSIHKRNLYDIAWNLLPVELEYPCEKKTVPAPPNLDEMLRIASKLSSDFLFVRVDLYSTPDRVYFGELTFYPGKGIERFRPFSNDLNFGEFLNLEERTS